MIAKNWVDTVIFLLLIFPLLLVLFNSFYRLLFLIVAHLPIRDNLQSGDQNSNLRLLLLIVARNEQSVIEQTLLQIQPQIDADNSVTVLADHCSDQTAQIAAEMGAKVFRAMLALRGKRKHYLGLLMKGGVSWLVRISSRFWMLIR